jgi:hypothetical protein
MNGTAARFLRLGVSLSGLMIMGSVLIGNAAPPAPEGLPTDWSHRHLIFSQPSTFEKVNQITSEPRYWQQFYRENVRRTLPPDAAASSDATSMVPGSQGFWSENMGSGASVGAGNYPAKYAFQINSASCSDYVVFSTGLAGTAGQASVVAYDNLYSGCTGTRPTVFWAFNTGGTIKTSPAISPGGSQVAFVQTAGGFGTLVLLKWKAGSGSVGTPTTLVAVANSAYRTCTAPCMTTIFLKNGSGSQTDDTTSSVFPDYTNDTIWVGGALGWLHKITGVFRGTPAEVNTGGYPVQVSNTTLSISSPVYDSTSGNVFVGDASGFLYRITTVSPPVVTKSGQVDHGTGLVAGPIVDSTAGRVYVFSSDDGSVACPGPVPCAAVYSFTTSFAAGNIPGGRARVGSSQVAPPNPNPLYEGGFDSTYFASGTATGNLYVCGNTAGAPTLYRITVNAGVLGAVVAGPALTSATTGCSPVSDIPNPNAAGGTAEWIYAGAQNSGVGNNCAGGGCLMNFNVQPWKAATAYVIGQEILDTKFQIQVVRVAGTSGAAHPGWSGAVDGSTAEAGTLRWTNQGLYAVTYPTWLPSHAYAAGAEIVDNNGKVEWVLTAGISKAGTAPAWSTVPNGATTDGTVHWRNLGALATFSLATAGGTSGIILDNTVVGDSQVYFSTQGNQNCVTSGTPGGCAIQASQSALQ